MSALQSKGAQNSDDLPGHVLQSDTVATALFEIKRRYDLAHTTYHLGHTVSALIDAPFVRTTYPPEWVASYFLKGYVRVDPVIREGFRRTDAFDWAEIELSASDEPFLRDAQTFGLGKRGYSIPICDSSRRRALVSFTSWHDQRAWLDQVRRFRKEWLGVAQQVHRLAMTEVYGRDDPFPHLSPREVECLTWLALGKDHKAIAEILDLSEYTVRGYTKSARLKLGCATLSAAVTRAGYLGLIAPWENRLPQDGGPI